MYFENSRIIDIIEDTLKLILKKHFDRYSKEVRANVKFIVIDMYKPYMVLIKELFPNAEIIIDRFHIVNLINRALNKTRIATMNETKEYYNMLKGYWRLHYSNNVINLMLYIMINVYVLHILWVNSILLTTFLMLIKFLKTPTTYINLYFMLYKTKVQHYF